MLGVVYLSRKKNPPRFLQFFLTSLKRHRAGLPYDLIIIQKGYENQDADPALARFEAPDLNKIIIHHARDETFATNSFFDLAKSVEHHHLLFFVSWSRILAPNWGKIMLGAYDTIADCGVVGASSGYERLNKDTPFPNGSIRTTGFLIRRQVFLDCEPESLAEKYDGNLFEAGPNSMTRRIEKIGLKPVLASRDGRYWQFEHWAKSRTFRYGDQEQLLFADNRTQHYAEASARKRRKLACLTWGSDIEVVTANPLARLRRKIWWRYDV